MALKEKLQELIEWTRQNSVTVADDSAIDADNATFKVVKLYELQKEIDRLIEEEIAAEDPYQDEPSARSLVPKGRAGVGRKPDYNLTAFLKSQQKANNSLGVAWVNESGAISIRLNPCISIQYNPDMLLSLWPTERETPKQRRESFEPDPDDEAPF